MAKWDALNKRNEGWKPGNWWDGYEEDGLVTCGNCLGGDVQDICTCQLVEPELTIIPEGGTDNRGTEEESEPETEQTFPDETIPIPEGGTEPGEERRARTPGCATTYKSQDSQTIPEGRSGNRI